MQQRLRYISTVCNLHPNSGLYTLVLIRASLEGTKAAGMIADSTIADLKASPLGLPFSSAAFTCQQLGSVSPCMLCLLLLLAARLLLKAV